MDEIAARVRAFVAGGASVAPTSVLRDYYVQLPAEGWLVELSRAHLRVLREQAFPHEQFAAWLGMRGAEIGRDYRRMLRRNEADREELVQLARVLLTYGDKRDLDLAQRSVAMNRFRRARESVERRTRVAQGRPTTERPTSGPLTREVERKRVELRTSVSDWSGALGMSAITYEARLMKERTGSPMWRAKLEQLAKDAAQLHAKLAAPIVARYPVLTREEMTAAYERVAADMEDLKQRMVDDAVAQNEVLNAGNHPDGFEPLDLYRWLRDPDADEDIPEEATL